MRVVGGGAEGVDDAIAALARRGAGVADQNTPVRSSRMKMASLGVSLTGSFDHGVSRRIWLLSAQVQANPRSVVMQPKFALAMTLVHGAGGSSQPSGWIS